jgi:geranylgeranyl pyrophosphate synthase
VDYIEARRAEVELALAGILPPMPLSPQVVSDAMAYSLLAGGKRLRPVLCLASADAVGGQREMAMPAACAIELIHTYSLIHDDLPAMDNDDLRRGRPTCHKQVDEATAILAGDALLTHAFQILADAYPASALGHALLARLARAAGSRHLIGGQMEDILGEGAALDEAQLDYIHQNKTSAMIEASLALGAIAGRASPAELSKLRQYGRHVGLAFQIMDDILDDHKRDVRKQCQARAK